MFLCVRIKTKGGERETHTNNALRPLNCINISTCQLNFLKTCLFGGYFLSEFKLHLEKTKGFSALPTPPYQEEQKAFYLKHSKRYLASITNMNTQSCRNFLNIQPLSLSWVFLQQSLLQALGQTQLLSYSSRLTMHSNSSGSEQYCITCQQNRQT